ncbi:PH domain-containing protein [Rhodoplanes roseus]|uniref:YdbS-like PH domain-containing protein n=1 Tax=Rhodoplanes roseus TaxID=29409 RepID=A0A327L5U0_9BRAD|nr:PH domain-containing protein [Rhodoplanes roseus]RAI45554.1 hypothetical protein CH341_03545 [Rhodoplanes roseus]
MGYVETVLQPGEIVRFRTKRHWVLYLPGLAVALPAAVWLGVAVVAYLEVDFPQTSDRVWLGASAAVLALGIVLLLRAWYRRRFTELAVTDRRVIYKAGLLRRSTSEMPLDRIEKIDVDQGILGQVLDFGTLTVNGVSSRIDSDRLRRIAAPNRFRSQVIASDRPPAPRPLVEEPGAVLVAAPVEVARIAAVPEPAAASPGR